MTNPNEKARRIAKSDRPQKQHNKRSHFNSKGSTTAIQIERVLNALRVGPHTSQDLRSQGIYDPSARVKNLRDLGYRIITVRVQLRDAYGFVHKNCALYSLEQGVH